MRVGTTLRVALACAFLTTPTLTASALAAGASQQEVACRDAAGALLEGDDAAAVCRAASAHVAGCVAEAWDHGLRGDDVVIACHEAEPITAECVADAWLDGLRGREVAVACHHREARRSALPSEDVFLAPARGAETAEVAACDGHVDVTRDALGRLEVNFSVVDGCPAFEVFDAAHVRRFTPEMKIGAGALRRTGTWTFPRRIVNAAAGGLALVMLDEDGDAKATVFVALER